MSHAFSSLVNFRAWDAPVIGSKAAHLAEAITLELPVPAGLIATPHAFQLVLEENGLEDDHRALLQAARRDAPETPALAEAFCARLRDAVWPESLVKAFMVRTVAQAPRLAVRSSATLEDTGVSAAAGLFHTALNVSPDRLPEEANRCWAEAHRAEVFAHLLAFGQDPGALVVPLLIQPMVEARAAGVLFSVDPADPRRKTMRLALGQGPGEAVVSGEEGRDLAVPRRGKLLQVPGLPPKALRALRRMALTLERHFGRALDIEWAFDGEEVSLLQARPITQLAPGAHKRSAIRWSRDLATERFPDPISPLGWTALQSALRVNLETLDRRFGLQAQRPDDVATVIGGYVYNNRDFFAIPQSMRFRWRAHQPFLSRYGKLLGELLTPTRWLDFRHLVGRKRGAIGAHPNDPRVRALAGLFDAYVFAHAREVETAWTVDFPRHLEAMDALGAEELTAKSTPALLDFARRVIARSDAFMEPDLAIYVIKMACRWLVEEFGALATGRKDPALLAALTGGLASNATLAMNAALDRLLDAVAKDGALVSALSSGDEAAIAAAWSASEACEAREGFLRDYGHVTLSWDIRHPTYRDRPSLLDELLAQRLVAGRAARVEDGRGALADAREQAAETIIAGLADAPWAQAFFRQLLETLHTFMRLDEEHHLYCGRLIPTERRIVAELASRLVRLGAFADPDDIHFLTLDEVFALAEESAPFNRGRLIDRRRQAYDRALLQRPIEEYLGDTPIAAEERELASDGICGVPASSGQVEGNVRVVTSMAEMAAFRPGEILVTPTPKPSYTPLFAVAGGLLTARGSTLSHGLITAREYGLPAVTEIHDLLDRLKTGDRVRLDGTTGHVELLVPAAVAVEA